MFYFDPLYMFVTLVGLLFSLWASGKVKWAFAKYSKLPDTSGLSGKEVAELMLRRQGIGEVSVGTTHSKGLFGLQGDGVLDDHYDPIHKAVRLSPAVYEGKSQAAVAIAAHEVGHAIQHTKAYSLFKLRSTIAPVAATGSQIGFYLLFSLAVIFQIITVPVEWDASKRAKTLLTEYGIVQKGGDAVGVAKVLNAAALTYVAAASAAIMNLLYFLLRSGLLGGRRN